jgi:hypothetical protein
MMKRTILQILYSLLLIDSALAQAPICNNAVCLPFKLLSPLR